MKVRKFMLGVCLFLSATMVAPSLLPLTDSGKVTVEAKTKKKKVRLIVGQKKTIKVKGGKIRKVTLKKKIVKVKKKGKKKFILTAKKAGKTTVTVRLTTGKKLNYAVTVRNKVTNQPSRPVVNQPGPQSGSRTTVSPGTSADSGKTTEAGSGKTTETKSGKTTEAESGTTEAESGTTEDSGNTSESSEQLNVYSFKSPLKFQKLTVDKTDVLCGQPTKIKFMATMISTDKVDSVDLVSYRGKIADLNDKGRDGDIVAGDGIFSSDVTLSSEEQKEEDYYVRYGDKYSKDEEYGEVTIYYYRQISDQDITAAKNLATDLEECISKDEAEEKLQSSDIVETDHYEFVDDHTAVYRTKAGITGVWTSIQGDSTVPTLQGTFDSNGHMVKSTMGHTYQEALNEVKENPKKYRNPNVKKDVFVVRPFQGVQFFNSDFEEIGNILKTASGGKLDLKDGSQASVDAFKHFDQYGVNLINTHGLFMDCKDNLPWTKVDQQPYLLTGQDPMKISEISDSDWQTESLIMVSGTKENGQNESIVALGPAFIDRHYQAGDLDHSIFVLGACSSMKNDTFAQAFSRKGAEVSFGFSDITSMGYCEEMTFETLVRRMLLEGYPARVAYAYAKGTAGQEDYYVPGTKFKMYPEDSIYANVNNGGISGSVRDAETGQPINGAYVTIKNQDGSQVVGGTYTNQYGKFYTELLPGTYTVVIEAYGYLMDTVDNVKVELTKNTSMEIASLLKPGTKVHIDGQVVDATTGKGIPDATINFYQFQGSSISMRVQYLTGGDFNLTTDEEGYYETDKLPSGYYRAIVKKDGYKTNYRNVMVLGGGSDQDIVLTPKLADDQMRVVLTWDREPMDLDLYLFAPKNGSNDQEYQVSYLSKNNGTYPQYADIASFDVEDYDGYGPETITIKKLTKGTYTCYVKQYEEGALANSNAKITLYIGDLEPATWSIPVDQGDGAYWKVFEIDGETKKINLTNEIEEKPSRDF